MIGEQKFIAFTSSSTVYGEPGQIPIARALVAWMVARVGWVT
jgi:hypothetical protein